MKFSTLVLVALALFAASAMAMPAWQKQGNNQHWKKPAQKQHWKKPAQKQHWKKPAQKQHWKKPAQKQPWHKPTKPTKPTKPVHPVKPTKPVHPAKPTKPVHPVKPTKPTKPVHPVKPGKPTRILTPVQAAKLRERVKAAGGCNANVCFAIDGSGSMPPAEFENEKNFVLDLISIIAVDTPVEVSAVQYATANTAISPLTVDIEGFNLNIQKTKQMKGKSFLVGGVNYCFSQLWRRRTEAIKIIMLGDGESNIGGNAIRRADLFRAIGGDLSVVAAGFANDKQLLKLAGNDPFKVFDVASFFDTLALQVIIEELVLDVCGIQH